MTDVYLNNSYVGHVEDANAFVKQVVDERRKNNISNNVNIVYDADSDIVFMENSKGRLRRPLIIVRNGVSVLTEKHIEQLEKGEIVFSDLVTAGVIEYLDALEEENAKVAFSEKDLTPAYTHLEIDPINMFGLAGSLVPFANYSPGARMSQGAKNQKQALGFYAANFPVRIDMDVSLLYQPQVPLVRTMLHEISDYSKHPFGQNITVAIMSFKGYNMEDAVVLNKGSIDRGVGRSVYFRQGVAEELRYSGGLTDQVCVPNKDVKGYRTENDYLMLNEDGITYPEANVKEGKIIIGRTSPPRFLSGLDEYNLATSSRRESSISLKHGEKGIVDFVFVTESSEGNRLVQVRIRDSKIPEIGDKLTSRYGQKGVIGLIVPQADMPFSASGITPDLVFSPHGIPSRMTMSHLLELIGGKVGALSGRFIDASTFNAEPEEQIRAELESLGFRDDGTEIMYNGETGEQLESRIYIGNMYYLKLKHMVSNKLHARARGPVQLLTRQPTEGRAKEGGLRLGEMEKDTFVAHGAALLLKERFNADKSIMPVCENCGLEAVYNAYKDKYYCAYCGDNVEINNVELSYAFKLFLDEIKSLGVYPQIELVDKF